MLLLHASVQVSTENFTFGPCARKLERVHNSLLHIPFPFMLINNAPLRLDHNRIQGGRTLYGTVHCHMVRSEQSEWSSNPPYSLGTSC